MYISFKRIMDIALSLLGIILLSPLYFLISLLVFINLGAPILFNQKRPGISGEIFKIYKFRTMLNITDNEDNLLSDEERLTGFGKQLRKTSLDELPELFNVLKGDMSLVGPRPLLVEYLELYNEEQARRHEIKPGITGWAQVNGRNTISWEEKFRLDVWYVDNCTLLLDIKILLLTIIKVIKQEDINQKENTTMEKFKGTSKTA